ncbi:RNA dependent RNA polymerase-domain-containing protein [Staphylotrichum tortipilum]|uniref:RNA-dependent RNA polymerase n=1 Tax=Staphylotrichum tortipilum TaxID=2831512 RepID=A0AAN6RWB3_9PEZI|nr:RNA dependent RNA polymerase-domain-containing protein [Staphylotrichum longicolle]
MEVFLRNLPPYMTDGALHKQLQPFMDQLSITDYLAEKQRNKTIGHVTFLRKTDGARFLQHHQEELLPQTPAQMQHRHRQHKHPPTRARLSLIGKPVFCKLSDREPDEYTLKSIQHESTQRVHPAVPAEPVTKALQATELNCGYYSLTGGKLVFSPEWTANESCLVRFSKRSLLITLDKRQVQLRIPFQSIVELVWWQNGSAAVSLRWAPSILAPPAAEDDLAAAYATLSLGHRRPAQRRRVEAIDENHGQVASLCLVYHFMVPNPITRHAKSDLEAELVKMKDNFPVTRHDFAFQRPVGMGFASAAASLRTQLAQYNTAGTLPFGLLLLLQGLVNNGYLHPVTVSALALKLAQRFAEAWKAGSGESPVSVDAFKRLFDWIDYPMPHGDPAMFEVDGIMEYLGEAERLVREGSRLGLNQPGEPQNRARIFKAMVTPTRVTLHGPELEPMNRLLRKYPDHSYFIRAQFCDEDGQDLFFSSKVSLDSIYARFKSVLTNGIPVAGRVYKLLGFSHSSLRAHSAWLSAPFVNEGQMQIPELIITGLGRFDNIKSPARRAARIGQAFSETPYAVDLDENGIQVLEIQDVKRNGRVFSDGIGTISLAAADAVYRALPKSKGFPTAFQVRRAGAKGMLTVDPLLQGGSMCVRPSMVKFESNDRELEICDVASKPMPMVLNRQLIKILEDMGAPDTWFLNLQGRELRRLRGITATVYNTANFLRSQKIGESIQLSGLLRHVEAMGIDYRTDAFLRGAVEVVLLRELRLLKRRARIPVGKGMTLFGVMDETGFLEENQVYVTYDDESRHSEPPGPGQVIVTRSPALHPGDVQLATNRLPPHDGHPLAYHRNCIVFSKWGNRDLPSQLSGGDLDGDVFHVIWDPEVIETVTTFSPADYPRVSPLELGRLVEAADIANFFVDFMQTDHLGVIATRHMVLADQRDHGTLDPDCIKLAELHSSAVDFSKTGRAWRPDFLSDDKDDEDNEEGPRFRYYESDKILGQLFRAVDEQNIWAQDIRMTVNMTQGPPFWDQLLAALEERASALGPVEWRDRVSEARIIQHTYEDAILGVMLDSADHPHQPLGELEVFVGFVINKSGVQTRRQRDSSVKLKEEFEHITAGITREMRNPGVPTGGSVRELGALELCLACLSVGCERQYRGGRPGHRVSSQDLESFKIVAAAAVIRELATHETRFNSLGMSAQCWQYSGTP